MTHSRWIGLATCLAVCLTACEEGEEPTTEPEVEEPTVEAPAAPAAEGPELAHGEELVPGSLVGTVRETMDSGGYTYMRVEEGARTNWVAAMQMDVEVGDRVEVTGGSMVHGFHSNTLDRDFEALIFATGARVLGEGAAPGAAPAAGSLPPGHPPMGGGMPSGHPGGAASPHGGGMPAGHPPTGG